MSGLIGSAEEKNPKWSVIYEKAITDSGEYYFPERLNKEFLDQAQRTLGSILFANQYLNEIFPSDKAVFKREWFKYTTELPAKLYTFAMIDPAISTEDGADYTGITVVSVDADANWYFRLAKRDRLNSTQLLDLPFKLMEQFNCNGIGIESVAFQKLYLSFVNVEMGKRKIVHLPLKEVKVPTDKTKEMRIMGALVPLFEWGRAYLTPGMEDFEKELLQFPRSKFDDISDSAAHLKDLVFYPTKDERKLHEQPPPQSRDYESYVIRQLSQRANDEL